MVLCVDAGNFFVKYALVSGARVVHLDRRETARPARLRPRAGRHANDLARVDGVMVSSVVPSHNPRLARMLFSVTGRKPLFVDYRSPLPFRLGVTTPRLLGVDRICAAAGAVRNGARSAIVVDVGSAITVDMVSGGVFRGGMILVGPALALRALASFTEKLPAIDPKRLSASRLRVDGTEAAMISGAVLGAAGAVRHAVRHARGLMPFGSRVYVTGGGARVLARHLPRTWRLDPDLVYKGLHELWRLSL
jgi:type III pantothenate kinase